MGDTRADARLTGRPRRALALLCALAGVLLIAGSGGWKEVIPQFIPEPAAAAPSMSSPTASTQTVDPSSSPSATSAAPKPSVTAIAQPIAVQKAVPTQLTFDSPSLGLHFVRDFGPPVQPVDNVVTPPYATAQDKVQAYLQTGGQTHLPGNPSDGTFFVFGHTYSDPKIEGAFDALQPLFTLLAKGVSVPTDMQVRLLMPGGQELVYKVTLAKLVPKDELPYRIDVYQYDKPGEGRVFACALSPSGKPTDDNLVLWLQYAATEGP